MLQVTYSPQMKNRIISQFEGKSQSPSAKLMTTFVKANKSVNGQYRLGNGDDMVKLDRFLNQYYEAPSENHTNGNISQSIYDNDIYLQNNMLGVKYMSLNYSSNDAKMVCDPQNTKSIVYNNPNSIYYPPNRAEYIPVPPILNIREGIPMPVLKTENGVSKTTYLMCEDNPMKPYGGLDIFKNGFNLQQVIENSSLEELKNKVVALPTLSQETINNIEGQYKAITKFEDCREKVFDKPVELATEAYKQIQNNGTPDGQTEIINLNDEGERLEVQKQGNVFNIAFYNEDNQLSMQGMFTLLRDGKGNPLKENKEGKIFKPGEEGYANEDNKLCFDIDYTMYYSDLDNKKPELKFSRKINLNDKKKRHTMSAKQFDRKGEPLPNSDSTFNFTLPKYTTDWLKGNLCKIAYKTSKHDLKGKKADFENDMLYPEDLEAKLN